MTEESQSSVASFKIKVMNAPLAFMGSHVTASHREHKYVPHKAGLSTAQTESASGCFGSTVFLS